MEFEFEYVNSLCIGLIYNNKKIYICRIILKAKRKNLLIMKNL